MKIKKALAQAVEKLENAKIKNPRIDAEILLSHILKKDKVFLFAYPEKELTKIQLEKFNKLIKRRIKGEPVAYLIGYKYFYGNKFLVNKNVLVPRPETELFIQSAERRARSMKKFTIIDIGTGSGCIIISLAKLFKGKHRFIATDISKKALSVAKKNAKLNQIDDKIGFIQGDLLEPIFKNQKLNIKNKNIIITANLPYLTPKQVKESPSIQKEPKLALIAGSDGLRYYQKLFKQIKKLKSLCVSCHVLCEIDPRQTSKTKKLIKQELPKAEFEIKKDLSGLDRLVIIKN